MQAAAVAHSRRLAAVSASLAFLNPRSAAAADLVRFVGLKRAYLTVLSSVEEAARLVAMLDESAHDFFRKVMLHTLHRQIRAKLFAHLLHQGALSADVVEAAEFMGAWTCGLAPAARASPRTDVAP